MFGIFSDPETSSPGITEGIDASELQQPPPVDINPETEVLFAAELARLSIKERDEMLQDIHGVADVQEEDPESAERSFRALEEELSQLPPAKTSAYLHARQMDESYVTKRDFLIMFLRATSFDPSAAASLVASFFQAKAELFGMDKLARDIEYGDLDEDDIRCLESGYAQILSGRDRAGRTIFFVMPMIRKYRTVQNRLRASYMVLMHALRDEETQRTGMVGIAYNVGAQYTSDREAVWKMAKLVGSLPTNFRGMHYCYDNERVKFLFNLAMFVWERQTRIRCRTHNGSDMECVYDLMTFGIPADVLPVLPSGDYRLEAHQDYCKRLRKWSEKSRDGVKRVILPNSLDVLLGRGKPLQRHPGNIRYHHIVDSFHGQYEKAQKLEKTTLSKLIVEKIKNTGGRFMKQDEIGWVEIDDEAARYKVSHTFRNHRIAERKKNGKAAENRRKMEDDTDLSMMSEQFMPGETEDLIAGFVPKRRRLSDVSRLS